MTKLREGWSLEYFILFILFYFILLACPEEYKKKTLDMQTKY